MDAPKLVVIDDELEFTKVLDQFLRLRGYDVSIALRGASGLRLIEEQRPDVVLVDLKMPGLNGDEVLRQVRHRYPKTQVIIITAYDDGATKDRLLALGAFAHLEKPLESLQLLAETIQQALKPPA